MFEELDEYLGKLKVPYLASLRQSTNYLRAFQRGMGDLRAAGVPGVAGLGAVGAGHEVAGEQARSQPSLSERLQAAAAVQRVTFGSRLAARQSCQALP